MTHTPPPDIILKLCDTFVRHREHYRSGQYNETQLRREFLDPFFKALGWDIDNERGYADAYKDVIHEDAIRMGVSTKAPDYCFRIGGARKFFVEAKKPSVNIESDSAPAYQLRRYGWSAKLPLSILSDFEEFAVYDTRLRPQKNDRPSVGRTLYVTCDQYAERWGEIAAVFSREAVLRGSFDKYADTSKQKRGTGTVDDAFLAEIERWRDVLARHLALRNPTLSVRDLNYAVQKTIDRIIFLRMCEDRGTEDYGRLQALLNGTRTYSRLMELFRQADDRYNSGLFHYECERGRSGTPDTLTPDLCVDDKVLKDILSNLYYPDSPYAFSVLPADILGQVYEQFLGKTIRLTAGHQAKIEEKPEVRKAGGVYYTPGYIVDYIVRNTLGRLLDGDDPAKPTPVTTAKAAEIRVLDPACGSGSFLIIAYQYLLDWHLRQYTADPATGTLDVAKAKKHAAGKAPRVYQASGAVWRLTTAERKRILLNGIHGVDIDAQAVEVTKLSLLLKVLEGETQQQLQRDFLSERQRILPDLDNNIKCGNSLIGPDFYEHQLMLLLDDDTQYRINVFDWNQGFPAIMKRGGFDCVIGNPPYRMLQPHNTEDAVLAYLRLHYVAAEFKIELFHLFLQRGVTLLINGGHFGYIVPTTLLNNVYAEKLRVWLSSRCCIESISVARGRVFAAADVHTSVIILRAEADVPKRHGHEVSTTSELSEAFVAQPTGFSKTKQIHFERMRGHVWNILLKEENADLFIRLAEGFPSLKDVATINRGLITGDRKKYFAASKLTDEHIEIITGSDVQRYFTANPLECVLFKRPETSGGCWDREVHLAQHKIVVRQIGTKPTASILTQPIAVTGNLFTVRSATLKFEKYLLGSINSKMISLYWQTMFADFKASFPQVTLFSLSQIPIRPIDFENPADVALHDKMVHLVDRMLDLNRKTAAERNPDLLRQIETQISLTDRQIDALVYQLYGLTPEEIAIVEGRGS